MLIACMLLLFSLLFVQKPDLISYTPVWIISSIIHLYDICIGAAVLQCIVTVLVLRLCQYLLHSPIVVADL